MNGSFKRLSGVMKGNHPVASAWAGVWTDTGAYAFGARDRDCDRVVELADFAGWATCRRGPGAGLLPSCEPFDFDADADVDSQDFVGFQAVFVDAGR